MVNDTASVPAGALYTGYVHPQQQASATETRRSVENAEQTNQEQTQDEYLDQPAGPIVQLVRDSERAYREVVARLSEPRQDVAPPDPPDETGSVGEHADVYA